MERKELICDTLRKNKWIYGSFDTSESLISVELRAKLVSAQTLAIIADTAEQFDLEWAIITRNNVFKVLFAL